MSRPLDTPITGAAPAADPRRASDLIARALAENRSALTEVEGKEVLAAYGIRTPAGTVATSAAEAAQATRALGEPVVLKALGHDIQHKTDRGLVVLDVRDESAARAAYHRLVDRAAGRTEGVLVEQMVPHERELLLGMRRDESFGPLVAFGLGGVFTEALHDVAFALAPLTDDDAARLIAGLRGQRFLGKLRGLPAVDRHALAHLLTTVGRIAVEHPQITELDVNPLLVSGTDLVAADALVIIDDAPGPLGAAGRARSASPPRFDSVFTPDSLAVVGASGDPRKWGGSLLKNIVDGGYAGRVYPVNPRGGEFFGLPGYGSLHDLPEVPELVYVVLGAAHTGAVIADCAALGVAAVVAIAAGYSEAGPDGERREAELGAAADAAEITLVGPNCMGVLANSSRLNALGYVAVRPEPGPLSIISQSGNIGTQMLMAAERRGIGIEKFVSVGNQVCSTAVDVLEHLAHDRHTGAVIMYIEEVTDGRRFYEVARRATERKPVVLIRGGVSAAGRRAAASHTGAMAGSEEVFAAAAEQAGVILSNDPDESLDMAACLAYLPLPRGRRVGVVTLGGGWGVLTADEITRRGLEVAELPSEVLAAIDELLPPFWSHGNPVDLVASVQGETPQQVLRLVAECEAVDAVLVLALIGSPSSGRNGQGGADADLNEAEYLVLSCIAETMERTGKPIIAVPLCPVTRSVFTGLGTHAPLIVPTPAAAVRALAGMVAYASRVRGRQGGSSEDTACRDIRRADDRRDPEPAQ